MTRTGSISSKATSKPACQSNDGEQRPGGGRCAQVPPVPIYEFTAYKDGVLVGVVVEDVSTSLHKSEPFLAHPPV